MRGHLREQWPGLEPAAALPQGHGRGRGGGSADGGSGEERAPCEERGLKQPKAALQRREECALPPGGAGGPLPLSPIPTEQPQQPENCPPNPS